MTTDEKKRFVILKLIEGLELPDSAYEKAVKRYEDFGEWLGRDDSSLKDNEPHIFAQGSFRLGTAIRPISNEEEYDLDLACKLKRGVSKETHSQKKFKHMIGKELKLYRDARKIKEDVKEKHRCWRLEYQDDLSFHMDIVPCIPEDEQLRKSLFNSLSSGGLTERIAHDASDLTVSITDDRDKNYDIVSSHWNISNPEGYAVWFEHQMKQLIRLDNKLEKAVQVEDIPLYKRKTPLQRVIQILKRHRDIMFASDDESKPISIIITTLSARAYSGEEDIFEAINNILDKMKKLVNSQAPRIPNPVDPQEDFADRWGMAKYKHLKLEEYFWTWLKQAKSDFSIIESSTDSAFIAKQANAKFRVNLDEKALRNGLGVSSIKKVSSPKKHIVKEGNKPWAAYFHD